MLVVELTESPHLQGAAVAVPEPSVDLRIIDIHFQFRCKMTSSGRTLRIFAFVLAALSFQREKLRFRFLTPIHGILSPVPTGSTGCVEAMNKNHRTCCLKSSHALRARIEYTQCGFLKDDFRRVLPDGHSECAAERAPTSPELDKPETLYA
jgi:hypothetical protein